MRKYKKFTKQILIQVSPEMRTKVEKISIKRKQTMSEFVRTCIQVGLDTQKKNLGFEGSLGLLEKLTIIKK